ITGNMDANDGTAHEHVPHVADAHAGGKQFADQAVDLFAELVSQLCEVHDEFLAHCPSQGRFLVLTAIWQSFRRRRRWRGRSARRGAGAEVALDAARSTNSFIQLSSTPVFDAARPARN